MCRSRRWGAGGFVRRTTARGDDGEWMVLTFWGTEQDAEAGASASTALSGVIDPATLRTKRYETLDYYCWTSITGLPSGSMMPARVGPPGTSKGSATTVAPRPVALSMESAEVAHLDVEVDAAAITLAEVAGRAGFGPAESGTDAHDRAVADVPVEQLAVEGPKALGIECLDLPVHHGRAQSSLTSRHYVSRRDDDLAVLLGVAERLERTGDAIEVDLASDHRGHVDLALGDRAERAGELGRVVAEANWMFSSLPIPKNGRDRVGLHADPDDDDPGSAPARPA